MIFALHLFRQSEEGFCLLLGILDQLFGDPVIGDDREAIFFEAVPELLGESVGIAFCVL